MDKQQEIDKLRELIRETINLNYPDGIHFMVLRVVSLGILLATYENKLEEFIPDMVMAKEGLVKMLEQLQDD